MTQRTDLSKYLIHSLRRPKVNDYPKGSESEMFFPLRDNNEVYDEYESLINIIEEGCLRASRSFRNGKATIYGGDPVVCFTEMPLINLIQYVKERHDNTRFTEYGIALLKKEVYKNGGRPVISGLSNDNNFEYENIEKRILSKSVLPFKEQYRYVKLDLEGGIDWTHEREWRVKCSKSSSELYISDNCDGSYMTYGINVFSDYLFSEVVIIVKEIEEAKEVHKIIQSQLDCGYAIGGPEFCTKIKYLIIDSAVEFLCKNDVNSIEDLPKNTFYSHKYETISEDEKSKVKKVLKDCALKSKIFANEFLSKPDLKFETNGLIIDSCGFAHISSYKEENKYVRFMLAEGLASAVGGCVWLNNMKIDVPFQQSISYASYIAQKQCDILNEEIENIFVVDSMVD